jgi:nucleotide-binding universal stress UspA family protein
VRKLLAAIDYSDITPEVVRKAAGLADALDAKLEILHIVAPEPAFVGYEAYAYPGRDQRAEELKSEKKLLTETVEGVRELGIDASGYMKESPVARGILEFADEHEIELIVLGTHGKGAVKRALLGSVSHEILHKTKIPILFIPAPES